MPRSTYSHKLVALARTVHRWLGALVDLDDDRRVRVARHASAISDTLARGLAALEALETTPTDVRAARAVARELGRVAGYVETLVEALRDHVDGRKLAGIERRLVGLAGDGVSVETASVAPTDAAARARLIERVAAAEGYFKALADGLRIPVTVSLDAAASDRTD